MLPSVTARTRALPIVLAVWAWIGYGWLGLALCQAQPLPEPSQRNLIVRWDAFHANTWIESPLVPGASEWHLLHGPSRAAEALRRMGCDCDTQIGPWTPESLEGVDLIVIPLVSVDRPPFLVSEMEALVNFVDRGGGLLVMTDASNRYYHNHALGALFQTFGMELSEYMVCEPTPHRLGNLASWIRLDTFSDHPMLRGIETMVMQGAGQVDARHGVVWSSNKSWGETATARASPMHDSREAPSDGLIEPGDPKGPLPVVAAREFGQGRIVVVADPDFLGSTSLNYADHRRFWLQASLWCARPSTHDAASGRDSNGRDSNPKERHGPDWASRAGAWLQRGMAGEEGRTKIWCYEPLKRREHYWGDPAPSGMFHAFAMLNRYADARGTDRPWSDADWMILADPVMLDRAEVVEQAISFAAQPGRRLAILCDNDLETTRSSVRRHFPNAREPQVSTKGWVTLELPERSQIVLVPHRRFWTNQSLPPPEKPLSSAESESEQNRLGWLVEGGLLPVPAVGDRVLWPDD